MEKYFKIPNKYPLKVEYCLPKNCLKIWARTNHYILLSAAHQISSCRHTIDGKEVQLSVMKTSPFFSDRLLFRNVPETPTKDLLINYMENVSGQDIKSTNHSDKPGDLLVIFQEKIGEYNVWKNAKNVGLIMRIIRSDCWIPFFSIPSTPFLHIVFHSYFSTLSLFHLYHRLYL